MAGNVRAALAPTVWAGRGALLSFREASVGLPTCALDAACLTCPQTDLAPRRETIREPAACSLPRTSSSSVGGLTERETPDLFFGWLAAAWTGRSEGVPGDDLHAEQLRPAICPWRRSAAPHRWRYGRSVGWTLKQCTVGSGTAPAFPSVSDSRGSTSMRRNAAMEGQSCSIAEFPREKRTKGF